MASPYEIHKSAQVVDVRPWGVRTAESLADPLNLLVFSLPILFLMLALPILMPVGLVALLVMFIASGSVGGVLPQRYPPGSKDSKGKPGNGIWYLGNMAYDREAEKRLPLENPIDRFKEVWFADDDARKHALVLGSTGSGKSELLKGIFFNAMCWGSGFFVADGKADNKLPLDTFSLARFFGRDDDYMVLNFLLAGATPEQVRRSRRRRTNKTNPFSTSDADTIVQMGTNLLPKVDGDAKNWQEKALNLWRGVVPALVWMRDHEGMPISVKTFVDYLSMERVEELYAKGYKMAQSNGGVWVEDWEGMKAYCEVGLPGFKKERCLKKFKVLPSTTAPGAKPEPMEQDASTLDQHGYRTTQLNPALNLLDKTYGHIFADKFSEIDMIDATLNNRILAMLIPSLERSSQEAESLGKLTVAMLRVMMGRNLGANIEGDRRTILESKATEANYPYIVALDELGYYFADGIAVMFAQARSLGFAMLAAAQDIEKLTEGSRAAEAGAMLANQVIKIFMRIDDANKTNEMIQKYLDKVTVALRRQYEHQSGMGFKRMLEVSVEDIPVATLKNLQGLGPGKAVLNAMGETIKLKSFYVGDFLAKYPREQFHINRFMQVRAFTPEEIERWSVPPVRLQQSYVKGDRLRQILAGQVAPGSQSREPVDLWALGADQPYAAKLQQAKALLDAIAEASRSFPEGHRGAQRAVSLFEAGKRHLQGGTLQGGAGSRVKTGGPVDRLVPEAEEVVDVLAAANHAELVSPPPAAGQDEGEVGAKVAQEGVQKSDAVTTAPGHPAKPKEEVTSFNDDPFDFLDEHRPLERKPASEILSQEVAINSGVMQDVAQTMKRLVEQSMSGEAAPQPAETEPEMPVEMEELLDGLMLRAFTLSIEHPLPIARPQALEERGSEALTAQQQAALASMEWVKKALVNAGSSLHGKGETLVGLTEESKRSICKLEQALGNPNPQAVTAAMEHLVAEQTTPPVMGGQPLDFADIDALLKEIDASGLN